MNLTWGSLLKDKNQRCDEVQLVNIKTMIKKPKWIRSCTMIGSSILYSHYNGEASCLQLVKATSTSLELVFSVYWVFFSFLFFRERERVYFFFFLGNDNKLQGMVFSFFWYWTRINTWVRKRRPLHGGVNHLRLSLKRSIIL